MEGAIVPYQDTLAARITSKFIGGGRPFFAPSIHRVPMSLRRVQEENYTPKLVSIGPCHHGSSWLAYMEAYKLYYLEDFITHQTLFTGHNLVQSYINRLRGLEMKARQCYGENILLSSEDFVEMMLTDGCFIIQFMLNFCGKTGSLHNHYDIIRSASWIGPVIANDMLLTENQLPFIVLECLYNREYWNCSFRDLSLEFFSKLSITNDNQAVRSSPYQPKHFVDLARVCYTPTNERMPPISKVEFQPIRSATELSAAGIKFERSESECVLDITFANGVMKIPPFHVYNKGGMGFALLVNLIAFENFGEGTTFISDYATFINCIVDAPEDVALLRRSGIIGWSANDAETSIALNIFSKGASVNPSTFYYARLFEDVNAYCKKRRHIWRAKLVSDYFNTPWSTISFVAAVILLVCTVVQTVYVVIYG